MTGNGWGIAIFSTTVPIAVLLLATFIRIAYILGTLRRKITDMQSSIDNQKMETQKHIDDPFAHPSLWKKYVNWPESI